MTKSNASIVNYESWWTGKSSWKGKEGEEDVIVFGAETTLNLYSLASLFELTTLLTGLTLYP